MKKRIPPRTGSSRFSLWKKDSVSRSVTPSEGCFYLPFVGHRPVKSDGSHTSFTIPGVKEDATDIILNLKGARVNCTRRLEGHLSDPSKEGTLRPEISRRTVR